MECLSDPFIPCGQVSCSLLHLPVATVASGVFRSAARRQLRQTVFGKIPLKAAQRICHVATSKTIVFCGLIFITFIWWMMQT